MANVWYKKFFEQKLRTLIKCYDNSNDVEKELIRQTVSIIEGLLMKAPAKETDISLLLEKDYLWLSQYTLFWPYISQFCQLNNGDFSKFEDPKTNFTNKEKLEMVHDFYKNGTNKEFFENFLKIYKNRKKNIHFGKALASSRDYADCIFLPYSREIYIQMNPLDTFRDIPTLSHEYGHGIQYLSNYHPNCFGPNYIFIEIISTFMELACFHYYSYNGNLKQVAIKSHVHTWSEITKSSEILRYELSLFNEIFNLNPADKNNLRIVIDALVNSHSSNDLNHILTEQPADDFIYIISASIAIELFMVYVNDPEKALYLLMKIIEIDFRLSPLEYLIKIRNLGITPNSSIPVYNDYLKRELKRF